MAEWGNPAAVRGSQHVVNQIAMCSDTQGTEPSQYLEEKTSKEIPTSSGERTGKSPNLCQRKKCTLLLAGGRWSKLEGRAGPREVEKAS